jgi:hypothetical protein
MVYKASHWLQRHHDEERVFERSIMVGLVKDIDILDNCNSIFWLSWTRILCTYILAGTVNVLQGRLSILV